MDVVMPDGTIIEGVPEGTTKAQLQEKLNAAPRAAPGSAPLPSYGDMMKESGMNILRRLPMTGMNPIGLAASFGAEGMSNAGKLLDRGAYSTGGMVTDALAPHTSPEVAGGAGYLANVGVQALPVVAGGAVGKQVQNMSDALAKRLMLDAINPSSKARVSGDAAKAVSTFLDEGAAASPGGIAKLRAVIPGEMAKVESAVAGSQGTVPKMEVANSILPVIERYRARNPFSPNVQAIEAEDVMSAFLKNKAVPQDIPVAQAQELKKGIQELLATEFGEKTTSATVKARKAMEFALRKAIEREAPAAAAPNARVSAILNAIEQAEPRASRGAGPTMLGLSPAAMDPKMGALMLADRNPWIRSMLAHALYKTGKTPVPTALGAGAGGIYSTADPGVP